MTSFLSAIDERVLVCDGAMGTVLYARGVFLNRSFDALNLTDPARVSRVYEEYVRAGADVIETNTFGANRIKLRAFGLADKLRDVNVEGARLAAAAARGEAYVAGAIGPLGIRIEPWGKTGVDEAEAYFREQAQALADGGIDLFVLETFRDMNEIGAAIAAVRSVCDLPIVAQMTVEEDGNSLDGTPPEQFAPALQGRADVIGINCSIGPAHMLETIERMARTTGARLAAQPNAGRPRDIEGRTLYLTSPEYMASYTRRFVGHGVRLVGGCCGTTPEHIRQIKMAVARLTAQAAAPASVAVSRTAADTAPVAASTVPRALKSALGHALATHRFVTIVELQPPKGHDVEQILERVRMLKIHGVDVVHVPEGPSGPRMSALSLAVLAQQRTGIETVLQYSCRDRNLLGMQSDLLGAHAMGMRNLMLVTGDVKPVGDYPDASAVFDVDSIGLVNMVTRLNHGLDIGGQTIGTATAFHIGVTVNPGAEDLDAEIRRFEYKVEAGAEFVVTRPVFDVASFERIHARMVSSRLPIVLGLWPFESVLSAEFMANEVPGVHVPDTVLERMRRTASAEAAQAEGIAIACEVGGALRSAVQGLHVAAPLGQVEPALAIVEAVRGLPT